MVIKATDGLSTQIYLDLKKKIEEFEYKPGDRISETSLAKHYNVSRTPIKHSLARLENDGIIAVRPQVGTFVSKIDINHIMEYFTIRKLLELSIIEDVKANIDSKHRAKLDVNIKMQHALLESFDEYDNIELSKEIWRLDNEFHRIIFSAAKSEFIWDFILSQSPQYNRYRVLSASYGKSSLMKIIKDHNSIFDYINNEADLNIGKVYDDHIFKALQKTIIELSQKYPDYFE